jgi:hypothetical protein
MPSPVAHAGPGFTSRNGPLTPTHPNDLPPAWFARWEERAAIVNEGCGYPPTVEGVRRANREAFEMTLAEMAEDARRKQ